MCLSMITSWTTVCHTASDLQANLPASAVVCHQSSTSDGLATAWPEDGGSQRGWRPCVIRQAGKRRATRRAGRGPGAGPTVPISLDRMVLRRRGTTAQARREAAAVRSADCQVHSVVAESDRAACQGEEGGVERWRPASKLNRHVRGVFLQPAVDTTVPGGAAVPTQGQLWPRGQGASS
jgi:hypothetical protein